MSSSSFGPRTLVKAEWRQWNKTSLTLLRRMGPGWWLALLMPVGLAWLWSGFAQNSGDMTQARWMVIAGAVVMAAIGLMFACAIQRGMERARLGQPAQVLSDLAAGFDDVLWSQWGRRRAIWNISMILIAIIFTGLMMLAASGVSATDAEAKPATFDHIHGVYLMLFAGLGTVYMFRMSGCLMDFLYHLQRRGLEPDEAHAMAQLGRAKNRHLTIFFSSFPVLPIWIWILSSTVDWYLFALIGVTLHFLWLTAMDYMIYQEIFEGGCKLEAKQVVAKEVSQGNMVAA